MGGQFRSYLTHQCTKMSQRESLGFLINLSKLYELYYLETGLYPSITDIVEAMITFIQERRNYRESCFTVKISRRTQKVEKCLAIEGCGPAFFSMDLGHIFGSNVGNEFGVMLRGKCPHKPEYAYNIIRIHALMIYTDLIEYIIVGDTKTALLRCFSSFQSPKLETS